MNLADIHWKIDQLSDFASFDANTKEALKATSQILAALRAFHELPQYANLNVILGSIQANAPVPLLADPLDAGPSEADFLAAIGPCGK